MRVIVAALATIGLAAICAWLLAWNSCLNLLPGHSGFDYFCGHNALLQVVPLFFLLLVIFAFLSGIIVRRWKNSRSTGS
jgi:uncharacterized membrane protein YhaH (DUF805 family)